MDFEFGKGGYARDPEITKNDLLCHQDQKLFQDFSQCMNNLASINQKMQNRIQELNEENRQLKANLDPAGDFTLYSKDEFDQKDFFSSNNDLKQEVMSLSQENKKLKKTNQHLIQKIKDLEDQLEIQQQLALTAENEVNEKKTEIMIMKEKLQRIRAEIARGGRARQLPQPHNQMRPSHHLPQNIGPLLPNESLSYEQLQNLEPVKIGLQTFFQEASIRKEQSIENFECSICKNTVELGENVSILVCDHKFHSSCIKQWLKDNKKCPICRINLEDCFNN